MRIWEGIYSIEGRMGDCCIYVVDCGEEIALMFGCKIIAHVLDSDPIEKGGRLTGVDLYGVPYTPVEVDIKVDTPQKRLEVKGFSSGEISMDLLILNGDLT
ncbi:MAG: hypothetical protein ACXQTD_02505 [Candidatus Syntropharchaeia archaeon]